MDTRGSVNAEEEIRFASQIILTTEDVRRAVNYILNCTADKIYAFTMVQDELSHLAKFAEDHLVYRLEKKPKTLDFYREVSVL